MLISFVLFISRNKLEIKHVQKKAWTKKISTHDIRITLCISLFGTNKEPFVAPTLKRILICERKNKKKSMIPCLCLSMCYLTFDLRITTNKADAEATAEMLLPLFKKKWGKEEIPQEGYIKLPKK